MSLTGSLLAVILAATHCLMAPSQVAAQRIIFAAPAIGIANDGEQEGNKKRFLFTFPTQANDIREALDDFQMYVGRKAWDKAFQSLDVARKAPEGKLLLGDDRFSLPIEYRLQRVLVQMPPEGREAYRVFYDAQAKKLLDEATGDKELPNLRQIVAGYFTTSVGDTAADRLGDLYFQRGEMRQAVESWQMILSNSPDSQIARPMLLMKSAIALARDGRWVEFRQIQQEVSERHAGEKLVLGGKEVLASEHLASLAASAPPPSESVALPADINLPEDVKPLWQHQFLTPTAGKSLTEIGRNWGWGRMPISEMVPATAVDDTRLYMNFVGYHSAVDLTNGKLVWRSGALHDLAAKLQNQYYVFPEQYALTSANGWLASVFKSPKVIGQHGQPFWLGRFDAATGKTTWSSDTVGALKSWNVCGTPLAVGDRIYATAYKTDSTTELHLLAVAASDGRVLWSTHLGTCQVDQSQMYYRRTAQPSVLLLGDNLYVDTQMGGLAAIGSERGNLLWGFNYEAEAPNTEYWNNPNFGMETLGAPLLSNGVLYVKGMRSTRLCAIEPATARLLWDRPVAKTAVILAVDGQQMLLGGDELTMLDLTTQKLQWATRLPLATGWTRPSVTKSRIYQFTPRGIFVLDKKSGDRVGLSRGADLESLGGLVQITPHGLLTVSNLAVTCYPLAQPAVAAQAAASTPQ